MSPITSLIFGIFPSTFRVLKNVPNYLPHLRDVREYLPHLGLLEKETGAVWVDSTSSASSGMSPITLGMSPITILAMSPRMRSVVPVLGVLQLDQVANSRPGRASTKKSARYLFGYERVKMLYEADQPPGPPRIELHDVSKSKEVQMA
jgi:hypothetical protein